MFLTAANLAHYLLFRGLLTPDSVVGGDFVLIEAGRRHRNFLLRRAGAPGLFIKQSPTVHGDTAVTIAREATFYQMLRDRPAFSRYAHVAPRLVDYDPSAMTLTVELLPDCENLAEYHGRAGGHPAGAARLLGEEMGAYHASAGPILGEPLNRAVFPHHLPWVFQVDETTLRVHYGSPGAQLAGLLGGHPGLLARTRELGAGWQYDCIVHGDMKWDNLLLRQADSGGARFHVIDWEMADAGDAAWDVGSVLASYLSYWVWLADAARQPAPDLYDPARAPQFQAIREALGAYWSCYSRARGFEAASAGQSLVRSAGFCAARLVTVAFEYLFNNPSGIETARSLLRVGEAIMNDPPRFAAECVAA